MSYNPDNYEMFVLVAEPPFGSRITKEIITGLQALTNKIEELLESAHEVKVYKCIEKEFEVIKKFTVTFTEEQDG